MLTKPIKWHGGKDYLASKIVAMMPPRCKNPNAPSPDDPGWLHYVEPYAGGLSVLLANEPDGISEVVNDLNRNLTNFWSHLQDNGSFKLLHRRLEATPFSHAEYVRAYEILKPHGGCDIYTPLDQALAFFVHCRQSLAGRMDAFAPLSKSRTRRGMNEQASAWLNAIEGLPAVHERLERVVILNQDALDVIRKQDGPRTLFYLDPPYLHETRATTSEYGAHEMDNDAHVALLALLSKLAGRFLLSGYHSRLYDTTAELHRWHCREFELPNQAAGGKEKRRMTECVWCNY